MKHEELSTLEVSFNQLIDTLLLKKAATEEFTVKLNSERSQFTRFNHAKVRQTGTVADGWIDLTLMQDQRSSFRQIPFTGNWEIDWQVTYKALQELREELPLLPLDPYLVLPLGTNTSREIHPGNLLVEEAVVSAVLESVAELDFTGFYAGGTVVHAYADSCGQKHWFATDSFTLDYSIFNSEGQAVKGIFAGSDWHQQAYIQKIQEAKKQLELLDRPIKQLPRGQYKTYFAPAAVADLLMMLSWGGTSEADLQQGNSALAALSRGEKQLSSKFNLKENFQRGTVPRFNEWGEMAALELPIITQGILVNTLINSRTAKEYQKTANGANSYESLRAPEINPGSLEFDRILPSLDTGLYVSNLHYLNWSDRPTGRITGMTRYACFWVENSEIIAPIDNLRFDDSLYRFWGENLLDFTNFQEFIPEVGTYEGRQLGGSMVPGMLVKDFTYTL
ncbi:metallopeptidase TldD-related protein [Fischerella thermalis]|uniref:metallopeptidase TldD-related protein n=1 Tax=Fischerella thermalis TaxID=372787 RepID=UPI000C80B5B0|nr:metallopeptidase TldD-related protein [Fischerella thermalis]MBF1988277.1 TldD/PmbA family protein [Fischerella thermalis M58_A2018_009]MBF2062701.1 TldD/PmbA family protein [Fischerella thermalis M66_A2018_004]MBF2069467.1 TldD/PmbA family protein [Fischerella thermalis M48_A2018_028]PLZ85917.1 Zn-dependent protease [Fischerella thermalis CCMEE 5194]